MIIVAMVAFANLFFGLETSLKTWERMSVQDTNAAEREESIRRMAA